MDSIYNVYKNDFFLSILVFNIRSVNFSLIHIQSHSHSRVVTNNFLHICRHLIEITWLKIGIRNIKIRFVRHTWCDCRPSVRNYVYEMIIASLVSPDNDIHVYIALTCSRREPTAHVSSYAIGCGYWDRFLVNELRRNLSLFFFILFEDILVSKNPIHRSNRLPPPPIFNCLF